MISLRLPSRMINRDRTDIRLLGQSITKDGTTHPSATQSDTRRLTGTIAACVLRLLYLIMIRIFGWLGWGRW